MFLDYSIEYDSSWEEFIGPKVTDISGGPLWIAVHTIKGQQFMYENTGMIMSLHDRRKFDHNEAFDLWNEFKRRKLNGTYGGFYWEDKNHTKHL